MADRDGRGGDMRGPYWSNSKPVYGPSGSGPDDYGLKNTTPVDPADHPATNIPQATEHHDGDQYPWNKSFGSDGR